MYEQKSMKLCLKRAAAEAELHGENLTIDESLSVPFPLLYFLTVISAAPELTLPPPTHSDVLLCIIKRRAQPPGGTRVTLGLFER